MIPFRHTFHRSGKPLLHTAVFLSLVAAVGLQVKWRTSTTVPPDLFHGYISSVAGVPPLARWDSIWFFGVAIEGYTGQAPDSRLTPAFLPLYPLLMRGLGDAAHIDYFTAGVWVSRLAVVAAVLLLTIYARERDEAAPGAAAVAATLLAFPSAYLLTAVYSQALFLALALAALVLARRGRHAWAAMAAFLASLTRIHGLALAPALAVLGWEQYRERRHGRWVPFLPALGGAAAYLALGAYFWTALGDPLAHFKAKREGWGQGFTAPWNTLGTAVDQLQYSFEHRELGTIYKALELPCFYLIVAAVGVMCARRWWPEATYTAAAMAMSLCSGSLAALPRFTLVMFPVFVVLAGLRRRPVIWGLYLAAGALLQGCLLVNYVRFAGPPP